MPDTTPRNRSASAAVRKPLLSRPSTWAAVLVVLGVFLFYWFQIRPTQIYRRCTSQASVDARNLLVSKAQMAQKGTALAAQYAELQQRGMYLRSDYTSFLQKCLLFYGRPLTPDAIPGAVNAGAGSSVSSK
jgi:hypothetical protein